MIPENPYSLYSFSLELIVATAIFVFGLKRRRFFVLRLLTGIGMMALFSYLWGLLPYSDIYLSIAKFALLFLLVMLAVYFSFDIPFLSALFCASAGYAVQHFSYKGIQMVITALENSYPDLINRLWILRLVYTVMFVLFVALAYWLFGQRVWKDRNLEFNNVGLIAISLILLTCTTTLNLIFEKHYDSIPRSLVYIDCLYDMFCCLLALLLQFGMFREKKITDEYSSMKKLWAAEKKQLEISKENMDYMRVMVHDLKHELNDSESIGHSTRLRELNERLNDFSSSIKTGNDTLDFVLAERQLKMKRLGITFTCIADGSLLAFMDETDVYSLFMNMVDNAIDALSELPSKDSRSFSFSIRKSMNLVIIHEENPYEGTIEFKNGLPLTTKGSELYHGLGTKSIKVVVDKYGGDLAIKTQGKLFMIDIVFSQSVKNAKGNDVQPIEKGNTKA